MAVEPGKMPSVRMDDYPTIEWLNETQWVYTPSQDRSRKGLEKILRAANQLFVENGYDETTITAISRQSGVSVGSIYHRFPDKQSILYAVLESHRRTRFAQVREMLDDQVWRNKGPADVLNFHIEIIFSSTRKDPGFYRLIERQRMVDTDIRDMQIAWNAEFCGVMIEMYRPHAAHFARKDLDRAVSYMHNIIRGSALWAILSSPPGDHPLAIHSDEYREEAFRMAAAYLGLSVD